MAGKGLNFTKTLICLHTVLQRMSGPQTNFLIAEGSKRETL